MNIRTSTIDESHISGHFPLAFKVPGIGEVQQRAPPIALTSSSSAKDEYCTPRQKIVHILTEMVRLCSKYVGVAELEGIIGRFDHKPEDLFTSKPPLSSSSSATVDLAETSSSKDGTFYSGVTTEYFQLVIRALSAGIDTFSRSEKNATDGGNTRGNIDAIPWESYCCDQISVDSFYPHDDTMRHTAYAKSEHNVTVRKFTVMMITIITGGDYDIRFKLSMEVPCEKPRGPSNFVRVKRLHSFTLDNFRYDLKTVQSGADIHIANSPQSTRTQEIEMEMLHSQAGKKEDPQKCAERLLTGMLRLISIGSAESSNTQNHDDTELHLFLAQESFDKQALLDYDLQHQCISPTALDIQRSVSAPPAPIGHILPSHQSSSSVCDYISPYHSLSVPVNMDQLHSFFQDAERAADSQANRTAMSVSATACSTALVEDANNHFSNVLHSSPICRSVVEQPRTSFSHEIDSFQLLDSDEEQFFGTRTCLHPALDIRPQSAPSSSSNCREPDIESSTPPRDRHKRRKRTCGSPHSSPIIFSSSVPVLATPITPLKLSPPNHTTGSVASPLPTIPMSTNTSVGPHTTILQEGFHRKMDIRSMIELMRRDNESIFWNK